MLKIFGFPHAGGSADFFDQLVCFLPENIKFYAMDYAGHGTRWREVFYQSFNELVKDMYKLIKEKVNVDDVYVLMGYSMGSIVTIELLKRIFQRHEMALPKSVILAAHAPQIKSDVAKCLAEGSNDLLKDKILDFGGIPEQLLKNNVFWRMYLPLYRADYKLINEYDFSKLNFSCELPALIFYSETDTPKIEMEEWRRILQGSCEFVKFEGNHFFIKEHSKQMAEAICASLKEWL